MSILECLSNSAAERILHEMGAVIAGPGSAISESALAGSDIFITRVGKVVRPAASMTWFRKRTNSLPVSSSAGNGVRGASGAKSEGLQYREADDHKLKASPPRADNWDDRSAEALDRRGGYQDREYRRLMTIRSSRTWE